MGAIFVVFFSILIAIFTRNGSSSGARSQQDKKEMISDFSSICQLEVIHFVVIQAEKHSSADLIIQFPFLFRLCMGSWIATVSPI